MVRVRVHNTESTLWLRECFASNSRASPFDVRLIEIALTNDADGMTCVVRCGRAASYATATIDKSERGERFLSQKAVASSWRRVVSEMSFAHKYQWKCSFVRTYAYSWRRKDDDGIGSFRQTTYLDNLITPPSKHLPFVFQSVWWFDTGCHSLPLDGSKEFRPNSTIKSANDRHINLECVCVCRTHATK